MRNAALTVALLGAALPAAAATDAEMIRCRALPDAAARLACYEALTPAATPFTAPATPGTPFVLPAAPPATPATPAAAPPAAGFGFEGRQPLPTDALESRVPGLFAGWQRGTRIKLENGQVWQVIDDSRAVIDRRDAKVRITRATFGSFLFEVEGRNTGARVRRVE